MEENDEIYLGLGLGLYTPKRDELQKNKKRLFFLDLSIPSDHSNDDRSSQGKEEDFTNFSENCSRKKLRLTRDQSMLLEDSFKQHSTLNTAQKQALAEKLKLKPRQVEVWFQNRRARTKLKQTEVECQFLKKNCERLNEENMRLKKELLELRNNSLSLNNNNKTNKSSFFYKTPALMQKCQSCHHKIDDHETTS